MGGQQIPINLSGLVAAALLILVALFDPNPLESNRPPRANVQPGPPGPFERVPARIWEDPFEAIARIPKAEPKATLHSLVIDCERQEARGSAEGIVPGPTAGVSPGGTTAGFSCKGKATPSPAPAPGSDQGEQREQREHPLIRRYLDHLATSGPTTRLMVMPILVRAARHPANREWRLRMRLAVHAAMARFEIYPIEPERIGVWKWTPSGLPEHISVDVPFEAFSWDFWRSSGACSEVRNYRDYRACKETRIILVLWLNDDAIRQNFGAVANSDANTASRRGSGSLAMIDDLLGQIGYPMSTGSTPPESFTCGVSHPSEPSTGKSDTDADPEKNTRGYRTREFSSCAVRVIGPATSDGLKDTFMELLGWQVHNCGDAYRHIDNSNGSLEKERGSAPWSDEPVNFELVSPFATAPLNDVDDAFSERHAARLTKNPIRIPNRKRSERGKKTKPCATIRVHRTVPTDDKAIFALVDELILRGVDPTSIRGGHGSALSSIFATPVRPDGHEKKQQ